MSATPAIPQPQTVAIAYIPVLHRGYRQFLESEKIDRLLLLNRESIPETIEYLKKDVRALSIEHVKTAIESWNLVDSVAVATFATLQELGKQSLGMQTSPSSPMNPALRIIMPDDDISEAVIAAYFPDSMIAHQPRPITLLPVFLRWDKKNAASKQTVKTEQSIAIDEAELRLFSQAYTAAGKSADWWRHVGCVITRNGEPIMTAWNEHLPNEQQPYLDGDARALFHAGDHIELTSAIHAEAAAIARSARAGLALEGCDMYVTTFPCPPCAKLIATTGIKRLFFAEGYAMFDGETILKEAGIEVIKVEVPEHIIALEDRRSTVVQYPR